MKRKLILETKRLTLSRFTPEDAHFIVCLLNSPGWLRFIGDRQVKNESQAKDYILNGPIKSYHEHGFGLSLVALKPDHVPIGMCGLLKRDYLDHPDIGFACLPEFTGNGYVYEIITATLEHARRTLSIPQVLAIVRPDNDASIGLLKRAGFVFIKMISQDPGKAALMLFRSPG